MIGYIGDQEMIILISAWHEFFHSYLDWIVGGVKWEAISKKYKLVLWKIKLGPCRTFQMIKWYVCVYMGWLGHCLNFKALHKLEPILPNLLWWWNVIDWALGLKYIYIFFFKWCEKLVDICVYSNDGQGETPHHCCRRCWRPHRHHCRKKYTFLD